MPRRVLDFTSPGKEAESEDSGLHELWFCFCENPGTRTEVSPENVFGGIPCFAGEFQGDPIRALSLNRETYQAL